MKRQADSDSSDDEDYVPPVEADGGSSSASDTDSEGEVRNEQEIAKEKKDLNKVWEDFQASVGTEVTEIWDDKLVKVVRKYRYAGVEHEDILEVPVDSEDAKRWPRYVEPTAEAQGDNNSNIAAANGASTSDSPPPSASAPVKRKPGPRKPKIALTPVAGPSKPKKVTTLEKSAMDWKKHVETDKESGIQDELEAHRKDGGYLDKVEFLQRVDDRKRRKL